MFPRTSEDELMPPIYTISVKAVDKIIAAAAVQSGADREELLRRAGLKSSMLADRDGRIPFAKLAALYEHAAAFAGDDAFGLHIGEKASLKAFDVLSYVVMNSADLGEAFDRLIRYHSIWNEGAEYDLNIDGSVARVAYRYKESAKEAERRHDCEMTLALTVKFGRVVTKVDWTPREVCFQHPEPKDTTEHRRIFRCPVRFSQPTNALMLDSSLLNFPLAEADTELGAVLDRHAGELLKKLPRHGSLANEVRSLLNEALKSGDVNLESVSGKLGINARTLQRRLKEEGTSHQDLLDELRLSLSKRYLLDSQMTIGEAAYLLGFSDTPTFHRAFRRWTGMTPRNFRQMAQQSSGELP